MPKSVGNNFPKVKALPKRQLWRYAQAGDLPDSADEVLELAKANRGKHAIVYTHKRDIPTYHEAAKLGLTINLSADSLSNADELAETGLPVTAVMAPEFHKDRNETVSEYRERLGGSLKVKTPAGRPVAICPATYMEKVSCSTCALCATPRANNTIIGFPAHGARRKRIAA